MPATDVQSPHRLVEFLAAISRCSGADEALRVASELAAEEFDAEVGAIVMAQTVRAAVGFGQRETPDAALSAIAMGIGTTTLTGIGSCHSLAADWNTGTRGRLLVARTQPEFGNADRNLLLGMASALGLAMDMIGALERERDRRRVLKVLLEIQRSISHRAPLSTILAAVTDGASSVLRGRPVSLRLDDAYDPERPIVAGADLTGAAATVSAPVHINGVPAGALVASDDDRAPLRPDERALLTAFAEHASLALTDARAVVAMAEAFRDPLTGLPNRTLFLDRLTQALARRNPLTSFLSVLFIDLDRFKAVNDSLGHAAGDLLLCEVAKRISGCTRADDTAARFGGDEFALLLESSDDQSRAVSVANRIIASLREPFTLQDEVVYIGATIGIANAEADHPEVDADELLSNADLAMYQAKAAGSGYALSYHPRMRAALMVRLDLQNQLQVALSHNELVLHYQPIVELASGETIGLEALLRWQHPKRGLVPPAEFIAIAETTGMILDIGRWALNEACRQLARWRLIDPVLRLNVNVSVHQLRDPTFPTQIERALARTHLPGAALVLEITEGVLLEDSELTLGTLRSLKLLGVAIALDDFGTGYSSLAYLQKFPVDILKIDRSIVSGAVAECGDDQLIRTIIELGHSYDLDVVAEGIEDEEQRAWLLELGCRHGQGFLFARPCDTAGIDAHLATGPDRPVGAHDSRSDNARPGRSCRTVDMIHRQAG